MVISPAQRQFILGNSYFRQVPWHHGVSCGSHCDHNSNDVVWEKRVVPGQIYSLVALRNHFLKRHILCSLYVALYFGIDQCHCRPRFCRIYHSVPLLWVRVAQSLNLCAFEKVWKYVHTDIWWYNICVHSVESRIVFGKCAMSSERLTWHTLLPSKRFGTSFVRPERPGHNGRHLT